MRKDNCSRKFIPKESEKISMKLTQNIRLHVSLRIQHEFIFKNFWMLLSADIRGTNLLAPKRIGS